MTTKEAVCEIYYYQYWLINGGIQPDYAKRQIDTIMFKFDEKSQEEIKRKVEAKFVL